VPPSLTEKLQSISKRLLKDKVPANPELRAKLTEEALRDSNEYSYSLTMIRTDPGDDPVLDFLENHKRGHCEYFASSLALLLRVQGIPTRVVNGFKGGEWNGLVGAYTFRDKHAHSWVEALITDANGRNLRWVTLDPTPGLERDAGIAQVGRGPRQFRTLSDAVRYIWTFYVAGFDSDRQNRVIYQPLRTVALEIWRVFKAAALKLTALAYGLFHYQSFGELVSIRGFFASVSLMLIAVGLFQGVRKLARSMIRGKKKHTDRDEEIPELALFNRLLAIMAGTGLQRKSTETPKEYASRAGDWLGTHFPSTENLASIPAEIVHAVYRVRFGKYPLAAHTADSLSAQLDLLQTRLAEPSSPEHLNRTST